MTFVTLLLASSLAFAQEQGAQEEEPEAPAQEAEPEAPTLEADPDAPTLETDLSEVPPGQGFGDVGHVAQAQMDARNAKMSMAPALIGGAAGFCPSPLCICLGIGGCLGVTGYYYRADAPPPEIGGIDDAAYLHAYNEEMKKRRTKAAFIGGAVGVTLGLAANVTFALVTGAFDAYL